MNRRDFNKVLSVAAVAPAGLAGSGVASAATWSLAANVAECCSCEIPCPCNFGRPTEQRCDGNRLIDGVPELASGPVARLERLGGILSHYYREAA